MIFKRKRKNLDNVGLDRKRTCTEFMFKPPSSSGSSGGVAASFNNFYDSSFASVDLKEEKLETQLSKSPQKKKLKKRQVKTIKRSKDEAEYKAIVKDSPGTKRQTRRKRSKPQIAGECVGMLGEEEKMLQIALRNSLRQKQISSFIPLHEIEEMKVYMPSEEEFSDPIQYIEKLYAEGAHEYGCVKIIPPTTFSPPNPMDKSSSKRMPTKLQTVQELSQAKPFDPNDEGLTFQEFIEKDPGSDKFKHLIDSKDYDQVERNFWNFMENPDSETINIEYASDLKSDEFTRKEATEDILYHEHPWNMNKLHLQNNSLLQFCQDKYISGITKSWLYVGMMYASFCWHYEDLMMYSLNYMHEGEGKIWYSIPDYHREKFERLVKDKLASRFSEDPNILMDINVMLNPAYLVENGVHVYRTLQKPGEIILTFPGSYHQGVSVGFNIAEAVNIACPSWLEYINKALGIYIATREKVPVFPVDWMLIECAKNINHYKFDPEQRAKLKHTYYEWLLKEQTERSLVASHYQDKERFHKENVWLMPNRKEVGEDTFECFY
eukprot:CAMPEP_0196998300 /NCGR_PEP_ID=MMETSP1380-20130617/3721_1 /TAXON_ID=5936 /ORGANISM="Euplotes crassus, Strain CT5" /LENGTH=548 /DNA_ID=CAMNT_0042414825 /DNA_START=26 /DNA_END=1672 /DNA_ORIENTATION=-